MPAGVFDLVGDLIGAGVQAYENYQDREYQKDLQRKKEQAIQKALGNANITYDQMGQLLSDYDTNRIRLADNDIVSQYKDIMTNYQPQTYDFDKFSYGKSVEDFINPEAEKIAQLAGLETQAGMAGQGNAKGTGGLANIGYSRWKAAEDLYKDAQAQMNADRSQAYAEYGDYIDRMQRKLDTISQGQLQKANLLGGAISNEQQQQGDYISDLLGIIGDRASTNINSVLGAF